MENIRRIYQKLKGIRSSLKTEVAVIEKEAQYKTIKDHSIENKVIDLTKEKTKLRKDFDEYTRKWTPYKKK